MIERNSRISVKIQEFDKVLKFTDPKTNRIIEWEITNYTKTIIADIDKCVKCGYNEVLERHHINPISKGGKNDKDNLVLLCPNCHTLLHKNKFTIKAITHTP
jgi:5-methylcytosine-specific restriction endonuclease McrA